MNDLENRLRDALAARAEQVTLESLRREPPPPPAVRRLRRWVVPGVTGLAVAATAAGVLVASTPARQAAQPAPPAATVSPRPTGTQATTRTPTPTSAPSPSTTADRTVAVPLLDRTLPRAGWRVTVPSTWTATRRPAAPRAEAFCMGTPEQPCLLQLAAGLDAAVRPEPRVLGAGLLPAFGTGCRQLGDASEKDVGGPSAGTTGWTCGQVTYLQVTVREDLLVAVARSAADPAVDAVVRALLVDPGYTRSFVEVSCDNVSFAKNSDNVAGSVRTRGVACEDAGAVIRRLRPKINVASGEPRVSVEGWACRVTRTDVALPTAAVACTGAAGRRLTFRLT